MNLTIYVLLGLLILYLEWRRHSRGEGLNAMTVFNVSYFVLFVLVPINIMRFGEDVVRQTYIFETYGFGDTSTALSLLLCYILFWLGYWWKSAPSPRPETGRRAFALRDSERIAKIVFLIGAILLAVYTVQLGGVSQVLSQATAIRFGETTLESKYVFYLNFLQFSADAFVLFFAVVITKRLRKAEITARDKVFLVCAMVFFVYYALSTAGRRQLIYPILLCCLVGWSAGVRMKKTAVVALVLLFAVAGVGTYLGPVLVSGNLSTLFDRLDMNQADWGALLKLTYDNASQGLADSYMHFVAMQKASLWQFGFLRDIVTLPLELLPSRLLGFQRSWDLSYQLNDFFGEQVLEGPTGESIGGDPPGLHGYLLVNFSYVGMFALFFLLGMFYKWLHVRFHPATRTDAVGWLIYWWFVLAFFAYFREGLLIFELKGQLTWWLVTAVLFYYRSRRSVVPILRPALANVRNLSTGQEQAT
jgi:hypothetical protein